MSSKLMANFQLARGACDYVLDKVGVEAANWDYYADKQGTFEEAYRSAHKQLSSSMKGKSSDEITNAAMQMAKQKHPKSMNTTDVCVYETSRPEAFSLNDANIKKFANEPGFNPDFDLDKRQIEMAQKYKCGNCSEMAGLAFTYLIGQLKSRSKLLSKSLCLITTTLHWFEFNLGEIDDHAICVIDCINPNSTVPSTWGPNAVICDPWMYGFMKAKKGNSSKGDTEGARAFRARELPEFLDEVFGYHDLKNFTMRGKATI